MADEELRILLNRSPFSFSPSFSLEESKSRLKPDSAIISALTALRDSHTTPALPDPATPSTLELMASDRGSVIGNLKIVFRGCEIDLAKRSSYGIRVPDTDHIVAMSSDALFVLVVANPSAFIHLSNRFYKRFPCILITNKRRPNVATRLFLNKIRAELKLPVLLLADCVPKTLEILSVYGPDIKWLGLRPSDLDKHEVPKHCRLRMSHRDFKVAKKMMEEEAVKENPGWVDELNLMVGTKRKAEVEAFCAISIQYLSEVYLPLKLQEQDWL